MHLSELYSDKATRNERVKTLRSQGYKVRTSTVTNQRISPHFITDLPDTDQGLANQYNRFFAKLFCIDEEW